MIPEGDDNPFRDNPYASPDLQNAGTPGGLPYPSASHRSLVGHVPAVAILMIVQGGLEVLMASILIAMGAVMPRLMQAEFAAQQGPGPRAGPTPEEMSWILLVVYGVWGLVVLGGALLHIVAGILNYRFRARARYRGLDCRDGDDDPNVLLCADRDCRGRLRTGLLHES